jgi:plastocyanin
MSPRRARVALILATTLLACHPDIDHRPVAVARVDLPKSYQFAPQAITVPVGTTVTWKNLDDFTHSVRLLDDGQMMLVLKPGDSTHFTFTTVGLHRYDCSFHPRDMHGSVLVTAASPSGPGASAGSP